MSNYTITTQAEIRKGFWEQHPQFKKMSGKKQNDYNATIRSAFVEYVDFMQKSGEISRALAERVTL